MNPPYLLLSYGPSGRISSLVIHPKKPPVLMCSLVNRLLQTGYNGSVTTVDGGDLEDDEERGSWPCNSLSLYHDSDLKEPDLRCLLST